MTPALDTAPLSPHSQRPVNRIQFITLNLMGGACALLILCDLGLGVLNSRVNQSVTATHSVTPSTEIRVMTETKVLLGRRYRSASSSSKGNPDMRAKLDGARPGVNQWSSNGAAGSGSGTAVLVARRRFRITHSSG